MFSALLISLRPKQWIKNLFVFLPLVFVRQFTELVPLEKTFLVFVLFSLLASGGYLLNDVLDRESDRIHPTKRYRPIASGRLPVSLALIVGVLLILSALLLAYFLNQLLVLIFGAYFLLQLAYSLRLKHVVILDLILIAIGFVLRVFAGAVVIHVATSPWLITVTFLTTLLLALGKRIQEVKSLKFVTGETRRVLVEYDLDFLMVALSTILPATLTAYFLYTFQAGQPEALLVTIPLVTYGLLRYSQLLRSRENTADGPTEMLLGDRPLLIAVILWIIAVLIVLSI